MISNTGIPGLEASVSAYYSARPTWLTGYVSFSDAQFLARNLVNEKAETVVEIGSASGFSTGVICHVLRLASEAGVIGPDFRAISYDISPVFYADRSKKVGDAAREQLNSELLAHITFRNPATAIDIQKLHARDEIRFMFIDADHRHPWPTLDLLVCLDCLSPGALVVLHDINLPILHPKTQDWGAKYLFDGLDVDKYRDTPRNGGIDNIGAIRIPAEKGHLKDQLARLLSAHKWEVEIADDILKAIGIDRKSIE